ncbi:isomerase [marine bacterium AO1-C]|nr:isomerase [marine bacterium AO1-C]
MKIPIYQIDAFTNNLFGGNPAAVCQLETWLPNDAMLAIAAENNLAETAFFVPSTNDPNADFEITWFTPAYEIDLCGHATLATAHVIWQYLGYSKDEIRLRSRQSGDLVVRKSGQYMELDFPSRPPQPVDTPPDFEAALGVKPVKVLKAREYVVVLENETAVRQAKPNYTLFADLDTIGVVITAQGDDSAVDFVSRCFDKLEEIGEDPVTGSAHCYLIPYWANILQKDQFLAHQISQRGGELHCKLLGDRVRIAGQAVTYLVGEIHL